MICSGHDLPNTNLAVLEYLENTLGHGMGAG